MPDERNHGVVGAAEAGDGVEQDDDILLVLDQALGLFDDHFGDLHVAPGGSSKVELITSPFTDALHVGDFLRPLVDQQDDQEDLRIVGNRLGDILQQYGLAGPRRSDDQRALALAKRGDDVDHPRALVLDGRIERVELELLVRIERGEIVEIDPVSDRVGLIEVDLRDLGQREITFAILGRPDLAFDGIAVRRPKRRTTLGAT